MNTSSVTLFAIYLVVFALIFVLRILIHRKDLGTEGEYDERQRVARAEGYRLAFFTLLLGEAMQLILIALDTNVTALWMGGILAVCTAVFVFASYAIWHDAYISLREKPANYLAMFGVMDLINLFAGIRTFNQPVEAGEVQFCWVNLALAVLFLLLLATMLMKKLVTKRAEE